jgi:phosphoribosylanthranilate isomerase
MKGANHQSQNPALKSRPQGFVRQADFMVKVCGITNLEDALISLKLGANALGFNFYPRSPRFIKPEAAGRIIEHLPKDVLRVGILVVAQNLHPPGDSKNRNNRPAPVHSMASSAGYPVELPRILASGINAVQVHGVQSETELGEWGVRVLVATSPEGVVEFPSHEIIIDTSWGTGQLADWDLLRNMERPYILSGGLTPENVAEALEILRPSGVDVCSGVEQLPGKKDRNKLEAFLTAVRSFVDDSRSNNRSQEN